MPFQSNAWHIHLTDGVVRRIFDALIKEMAHQDMTIAGKKFLVFFKRAWIHKSMFYIYTPFCIHSFGILKCFKDVQLMGSGTAYDQRE